MQSILARIDPCTSVFKQQDQYRPMSIGSRKTAPGVVGHVDIGTPMSPDSPLGLGLIYDSSCQISSSDPV